MSENSGSFVFGATAPLFLEFVPWGISLPSMKACNYWPHFLSTLLCSWDCPHKQHCANNSQRDISQKSLCAHIQTLVNCERALCSTHSSWVCELSHKSSWHNVIRCFWQHGTYCDDTKTHGWAVLMLLSSYCFTRVQSNIISCNC